MFHEVAVEGGGTFVLADTDLWGLECALRHGLGDRYFDENKEWAERMLASIERLREGVPQGRKDADGD